MSSFSELLVGVPWGGLLGVGGYFNICKLGQPGEVMQYAVCSGRLYSLKMAMILSHIMDSSRNLSYPHRGEYNSPLFESVSTNRLWWQCLSDFG